GQREAPEGNGGAAHGEVAPRRLRLCGLPAEHPRQDRGERLFRPRRAACVGLDAPQLERADERPDAARLHGGKRHRALQEGRRPLGRRNAQDQPAARHHRRRGRMTRSITTEPMDWERPSARFLAYLDRLAAACITRDRAELEKLMRMRMSSHVPRAVVDELEYFKRASSENLRAPLKLM